jgi:lactoylglutathione lyase
MNAIFKNAWGYQGNRMGLPVADLEAALPFYEKIFGFRLLSRSELPHKSAVLERDGIEIGFAENGSDPTQDGCAFEVDSVESAFAEFKANGLEKELSEFEIEKHDDGSSWKVFFVIAPDGLCYWFGEKQTSEVAED